jgi:hypothetical protein
VADIAVGSGGCFEVLFRQSFYGRKRCHDAYEAEIVTERGIYARIVSADDTKLFQEA